MVYSDARMSPGSFGGIVKLSRRDAFQYLNEKLAGLPFSHGQIVQQVVTAVAWCGSRHLALVVGYEGKRSAHQVYDVTALIVAPYQKVVAREATHGSPIYNAVFPLFVVAKEGGGQMFYGV